MSYVCDLSVISLPRIGTRRGRWEPIMSSELWSGARDLNPGPHGPEPAPWRAVQFPLGSSSVLLYLIGALLVTLRVLPYLLVPELRDTVVTSAVVSAIAKGSFLGQAGWSVGDHEI